jgi:[protein-PII] uridylyltransferase
MALDSFGIQNADDRTAVADPRRLERIRRNIELALEGQLWLDRALEGRRSLPERAHVFQVEPRALIDNSASRTHTVIEVNGWDRPGLLYDVAKTLKDLGTVISSAHISTYGERVVDVFYVKDVFGLKITQPSKVRQIQRKLVASLEPEGSAPPAPEGARSRAAAVGS